jgi:hypothetical protein
MSGVGIPAMHLSCGVRSTIAGLWVRNLEQGRIPMSVRLITCWPALATLWLLSPPGPATAAEDPPPAKSTTPPTTYVNEMRFLDLDRDRRIDQRELATGQQMAAMILLLSWDECDRDGDGSLSHDEFEQAAATAMQALLEEQSETDAEEQAEQDLAQAVPLELILDRLTADERYADEVADLRDAVEDLDDDEDVVTYVFRNAKRYPRLTPVVRTWVRHYPVRPDLRRHAKPHPKWRYLRPAKAKPHKPVKPAPRAGKPARPGKRAQPGKPAKPPKPRRPGRP